MKLFQSSWLLLSFATITVFGSQSLAELCGDTASVHQSTLNSGGEQITVKTSKCSAGVTSTMNTLAIADDILKCDKSANACATKCNSTIPQPDELDCNALVLALNRLDADTFTASPMTLTAFSVRKCSFGFVNLDPVNSYEVCNIQFTMQALATLTTCDITSSGTLAGNCIPSQTDNNAWAVEVTRDMGTLA